MLVEPNSGNSEMGEYYEIPQDHLGICKPANRYFSVTNSFTIIRVFFFRYSFLYQKVVYLIREIMQKEINKQIDLHQFD